MTRRTTSPPPIVLALLSLLLVGSLALSACGSQPAPDTLTRETGSGSNGSSGGSGGSGSGDKGGLLQVGSTAPDFSYTAADGTTGSLADQRGKVVLINFWASWCGPCVKEMPDLDRLRGEYANVAFLAVATSDEPRDAQAFIDGNGYGFTWILDTDGAISKLYPSDYIPYTIVVDKDGVVSSIYVGSNSYETYKAALVAAGA